MNQDQEELGIWDDARQGHKDFMAYRGVFSYELMFCRTAEELNKILQELSKKREIMPILMFLYKEG